MHMRGIKGPFGLEEKDYKNREAQSPQVTT